ncbi:MAG: ATP-binding cassette domain-containing protein [Lachnospiraceae bacterium]|nr:ATP-binding cassette domain-containing protein [Lachnospiraceae bacterium]
MADNVIRLKLRGAKKYITGDPEEVFYVEEGTVYVYVVSALGTKIGRSLFLTEVNEGDTIPALTVQNHDTDEFWMFLLIGKTKAVVRVEKSTEDISKIREEFIEKHTGITEYDDRFSIKLFKWYNEKLEKEEAEISSMNIDRKKTYENKLHMMADIFRKEKHISYDTETPSDLYNTVSTYCNYMKVNICSYQNVISNWGEDFSIEDIARLSHFVARKITLEDKWHKKDAGVFLGFKTDDNTPVLLVPHRGSNYIMYDLKRKIDTVVDEYVAKSLAKEGYVIYQHLPSKALRLRDVFSFGVKRIQTRDMALFLTMYVIATLIGLLLPELHQRLFDKLIPLGRMDDIYEIGIVILVVMIGNMFFGVVQGLANFRAVKTLEYSIVSATYDRIFRLPQKFIDRFGISELVSRISSVSQVFSSTLTSGTTAILGFILSLFYLWKMFDKNKTLAWRGLIMSLISAFVMFAFSYFRIEKERKKLEEGTKADNTLYQSIAGILKVKVSSLENRSLYQYQKYNTEMLSEDIASTRISNSGEAFKTVMTMFYTGFIYYTVIKKKQELTIGEYTAFSSAYGMFTSAVGQLMTFFLTMAQLIPVMERIKPIFGQEAEVSDSASLSSRLNGEIEVKHLEFAYDDEDQQVLKDINMTIKPGEFIGIVGPSGCGKSTLLKCMLGFETATRGKIYYDNKDIDTLDKCEMRRQMGIVLQDGKLVLGNIFTNIALASPQMTPTEAEELLKEVGLYEDVQEMPMGIFTGISDGGGTISGGQQQRVLIARALANNPKIVLFDEATSALDNVTQQKVCESLEARNMTRVMIAHRLSTVKNCDKIFVMEKGEIVEEGNYEELIENKGLFYELAKRQQIEDGIDSDVE